MTELNTQRGWEERFEEYIENESMLDWRIVKDLVPYIRTELTKARESYRQEIRKKVEGKSKSCTDECMSQFYDHDCCDCGAREYNQCKDDLLTIISE